MKKVNLLEECERLNKAIGSDEDVKSLNYNGKLDFLARGVMYGWYGNDLVQKKILGNLYKPVTSRIKY